MSHTPRFKQIGRADVDRLSLGGAPIADPQKFGIGGWTLDQRAREATNGQTTKRLSPRAMELLAVLAKAGGEVVRRADLLDAVWPDVHVSDESLTQAVTELRRTLGKNKDGSALIETVPKAGYRLASAVLWDVTPNSSKTSWPAETSGSNPACQAEAHLAVLEARRLARARGVLAVDDIDRLISDATKGAPDAAYVQAEYAVQMVLAALHVGGRHWRFTRAIEAANTAVQLRPDLIASHRALGFVQGMLGDFGAAMKSFACSIAIDPDDFEAHYMASKVCMGTGRMKQSMILGQRAAELEPDDYRPAFNAARAALKLGDEERARELAALALRRIEAALELAPRARRYLSARAAATSMLGSCIDDVDTILRRAEDQGLFYDVVSLTHLGAIDLACDLLDQLVASGMSYAGWICSDPVSDMLSSERRFLQAIEVMQSA